MSRFDDEGRIPDKEYWANQDDLEVPLRWLRDWVWGDEPSGTERS